MRERARRREAQGLGGGAERGARARAGALPPRLARRRAHALDRVVLAQDVAERDKVVEPGVALLLHLAQQRRELAVDELLRLHLDAQRVRRVHLLRVERARVLPVAAVGCAREVVRVHKHVHAHPHPRSHALQQAGQASRAEVFGQAVQDQRAPRLRARRGAQGPAERLEGLSRARAAPSAALAAAVVWRPVVSPADLGPAGEHDGRAAQPPRRGLGDRALRVRRGHRRLAWGVGRRSFAIPR